MDDNTQQNQQPADTMSSLNDVAGMTPPPPAPVMPSEPAMAAPAAATQAPADDYTYAEDVLNEILDSLDRIEVKLEAMEKKMG